MGAFDDLICEYPLPKYGVVDEEFQTKDLYGLQQTYTITKEGRLIRQRNSPQHQDMEYHGDVHFYGHIKNKFRYFIARFIEGELQWIEEMIPTA